MIKIVVAAVVTIVAYLPGLSLAAESAPQFVRAWGTYGGGNGQFARPKGIAVGQDGIVYVADSDNSRIQKFTSDGAFIMKWGEPGPFEHQLSGPFDIALDGDIMYISAGYGNKKFTTSGEYLTNWGDSGYMYGRIVLTPTGELLLPDVDDHLILKFDGNGALTGSWASSGPCFEYPAGIARALNGDLFISDYYGDCVQRITSTGELVSVLAFDFDTPDGMTIDSKGNLYVTDFYNGRIAKFSDSGELLVTWGTTGSGPGQFLYPKDVAVDDDGNIYVADTGNHRIQKFSPSGPTPLQRTTWSRIKSLYR